MADAVASREGAESEEARMSRLHRLSAAQLLASPAFPRITPDEEFLLRDWLATVGDLYDEFSVDVPVGSGALAGSLSGGVLDRMWAAITRRRVDLVAVGGHTVHIVEAKLYARMSTVTQVLRYCAAYRDDHPEAWYVEPIIVCRTASPGVGELLARHRGALVEVPATAPALEISA